MSPADDLVRLVEGLRAPYGYERSIKIAPGALYDERCLLSVHARALRPHPAHTLIEMGRALGAPPRLDAAIREALPGADIVHFGHEAGEGAPLSKLYFEYAARAKASMAQRRPALVHLAYKWRRGEAEARLTRYLWRPCLSAAEARARVEARLPEAARARAAALAVLERSAELADSGALAILDVEEAASPRASLDVNLYDAGLSLADVADVVARTGEAFAVAPSRVEASFGAARASALGHVAAGVDRAAREFVTFYFGVEARGA
jgi:hypothetical protein